MVDVDPTQIARALELLRAGDVVAIPTETVYGLAADATNPDAIKRIYDLKGRPPTNPLIAHVASIEVAERFAHVDDRARKIFECFAPGPISVVLPKRDGPKSIAPEATAGLPSVAIRIPKHPIALELLKKFDGPLAAPSANKSNHVSPTTAQHVRDEFGDRVFIIDGGPCSIGIESTVLDLTTSRARILRPGHVMRELIESTIGDVDTVDPSTDESIDQDQPALSPGMQKKHYAPTTPAYRFDRSQSEDALKKSERQSRAVIVFGNETIETNFDLTEDPTHAAHHFYDTLRRIDGEHFEVILIEIPPEGSEWLGLHDRIRRATQPIDALKSPAR